MPIKQKYYEPDAIDCNTMITAIGQDFAGICEIITTYERDVVQVVVRVRKVGVDQLNVVQVQALCKSPLKPARSLYVLQYGALLDCWHQLDRGVLGVAQTPIERGWDGRPRAPWRPKA